MAESTRRIIPTDYLGRPAPELARDLLGQFLCRRVGGRLLRLRLTELEAYDGFEDRASHAHRGPTPRNSVMFGPPGYWYVYLCYGVHWLLNIVTGPETYPAAVLIRGAGSVSGPGRLTRELRIDGSLNLQAASVDTNLWLEFAERPVPDSEVTRTPRIGVGYAGPAWKDAPLRMLWKDAGNQPG